MLLLLDINQKTNNILLAGELQPTAIFSLMLQLHPVDLVAVLEDYLTDVYPISIFYPFKVI